MKYNYFEKATISVTNSIKDVFKNFAYVSNINKSQPFPIYIQTSGDDAFMSIHSDRLEVTKKTDTIYIPSLKIKFDGIDINDSDMTNDIIDGKLVIEIDGIKTEKVGTMNTYPITLRMSGYVLMSNIFQYLSFVEYCMNGVYKQRNFKFQYMGKVQNGQWSLETSSHDVEYSDTSSFGEEVIASHQLPINFEIYLQYPSFNLNETLGGDLDGDGDGYKEGGIGGHKSKIGDDNSLGNNLMDSNNTIKGVVHYVDLETETNKVSKDITGTVNNNKIKPLNE